MADHMDADQITAIPVQSYDPGVRAQLRSGDLMFASGNYLVSKMIERFTKSPWSHVGIIFALPSIDRVLLLESVEDAGVRLAPLSKYLDDYDDKGNAYDGTIVVARPAGVGNDMVKSIAEFGIDELTRPYDKEEIGEIAARISLGIGLAPANDRTYICSELVQACFAKANYNFVIGDGAFITPEDIWVDSRVSLLARIQ
jgi:hypothetical protein